MKLLKIYFLLPFLCLTWSSQAQTSFTVDQNNLQQVVNDIQQIYGSQIGLSNSDIENFLSPFVQNTVPASLCPPPSPQIDQITNGSISFSWPPLTTSLNYGTYYLQLQNGSNTQGTTGNPGIQYNSLQGLYLFGFYSNCGGGTRGPNHLIIVDIDVLYPADDMDSYCDCTTPSNTVLYGGFGPTATSYTSPWVSGSCNSTRYRLRVAGSIGETTYYSEISFNHLQEGGSHEIQFLTLCNDNASTSSSNPLYVGSEMDGPVYYILSFTSSQVIINFPDSELSMSSLIFDHCTCNDGRRWLWPGFPQAIAGSRTKGNSQSCQRPGGTAFLLESSIDGTGGGL